MMGKILLPRDLYDCYINHVTVLIFAFSAVYHEKISQIHETSGFVKTSPRHLHLGIRPYLNILEFPLNKNIITAPGFDESFIQKLFFSL